MSHIKFTRVNEWFEPSFRVKSLKQLSETLVKTSTGVARLTRYTSNKGVEFYSFGVLSSDIGNRPGHGGEWSSNAEFINKVFGVDLISCVVEDAEGKYAMAVSKISINLPETLYWNDTGRMILPRLLFPIGFDYYRTTTVNANGTLAYPNPVAISTGLSKLKEDGIAVDKKQHELYQMWMQCYLMSAGDLMRIKQFQLDET